MTSLKDYVTAEHAITTAMTSVGLPAHFNNADYIGKLIVTGQSVNEITWKIQNGLGAAEQAPAEVQQTFLNMFGEKGPDALAAVYLDPSLNEVQLQKMFGAAQIGGAAQAAGLPITNGLSQRLADQGVTYQGAQQAFKNLTSEAGLFQQTQGEALSQTPVAGTSNANTPLTEANQGVQAAFGLSPQAEQQVKQVAEARANEFRAGSSGVSTGNACQFGSVFSTDASTSEISSPSNARRPLSISNTTTPKAQMSARLSTVLPRACSGLM